MIKNLMLAFAVTSFAVFVTGGLGEFMALSPAEELKLAKAISFFCFLATLIFSQPILVSVRRSDKAKTILAAFITSGTFGLVAFLLALTHAEAISALRLAELMFGSTLLVTYCSWRKTLRPQEKVQKEVKRYRLGNRPEEYELREDYLGWIPENGSWQDLYIQGIRNVEVTIVNPAGGSRKVLFLHHFLIKDAFPMSFFGEERSKNWWVFAKVSDTSSTKFVIPLH